MNILSPLASHVLTASIERPSSFRTPQRLRLARFNAHSNLRLAAVRRVAYEAADAGLLSPELAAGIRRVKGVRRLGVRLGNWLTVEQGRRLLHCNGSLTLRELRDYASVDPARSSRSQVRWELRCSRRINISNDVS